MREINRRQFLGALGAMTAGFLGVQKREGTPQDLSPQERQSQEPKQHEIATPEAHEIVPPEKQKEEQEYNIPEELQLRMSDTVRQLINTQKQQLLDPTVYGAREVFERGETETFHGRPLIDVVHDTFHEALDTAPSFDTFSDEIKEWMTDLCAYGQVTRESSWERYVQNNHSSAEGLWQLMDIAAAQIAIERRAGTERVNRTDPVDATRGAVDMYTYIYRALRSNIDDVMERYDVSFEEFGLPLMISAYQSGARSIERALEHYLESRTDTPTNQPKGLDLFYDFTEHLRNNNLPIPAGTPDYFFKILALKEIYKDLQRDV